ncbi:pilus assembly protein TadG-related protein, partial [Sphingomonas sp.]|uniref:pilus assembly protein TadG-related protein n=1 Tax=Sphingomonas sp. TaxID=28214 RepID=UPI00374FF932
FLRKILGDKRGNALLIVAGAMPMIVGCAGLASDTIQWSLWKRQLQRAADSAAIAGVYDRVNSSGSTTTVAATVAHDLTLNQHTWMSNLTGYPAVTYPANSGVMTNQVKVSLAIQQSLPFSSLFMTAAPTIIANSTAAGVPGVGEYCVVSLEPLASNTGITIGGSANIDMDCGMISNSPATNSALANGNSSRVSATVIAAVGGVQASNSWTVGQYTPYSPPYADPFANVPVPIPSGCTAFPSSNNLNFASDPAHASGKTVCYNSNMTIKGDVVLGPATYILDAASIKMTTTAASLTCNGCTIILTSSTASTTPSSIGTMSVSGGRLNLVAPTTGTYKGMALYQDRRALDSAGTNIINGNSGSIVQGTIYFPSQQLTYNGDGTTVAVCTQFVTRRIIFTGNNTTSNKFAKGSTCGDTVAGTLGGGRLVRLVA